MAKVPVAVRLEPPVLNRLDAYAKRRGTSRQVLLESAVAGFLESAERGVPDLPVVDTPEVQQLRRSQETAADWAMTRQAKLNAAKYRRAS